MKDSRLNLHATGVVLGRRGYLIMGPSGSGKSQLARLLLENAWQNGLLPPLWPMTGYGWKPEAAE